MSKMKNKGTDYFKHILCDHDVRRIVRNIQRGYNRNTWMLADVKRGDARTCFMDIIKSHVDKNEHNERMRNRLASAAEKGEAIKSLGKMCGTCAFRRGSVTNMYEPDNVEAAMETIACYGTFHCHKQKADGTMEDAGRVCVGFLHAKQYFESKE